MWQLPAAFVWRRQQPAAQMFGKESNLWLVTSKWTTKWCNLAGQAYSVYYEIISSSVWTPCRPSIGCCFNLQELFQWFSAVSSHSPPLWQWWPRTLPLQLHSSSTLGDTVREREACTQPFITGQLGNTIVTGFECRLLALTALAII